MRTTIALGTFLVVGAGALGASALDLKGSDTLEGITKELLTTAAWDCGGTTNTPAGTLVYVGTGSSNGETAIINGIQQVAPMSRFLNPAAPSNPIGSGAVCNTPNTPDGGGPGPSESTAEGIAFARDGLSIVVSQGTGGTDACNGLEGSACSPVQNKGLAFEPTANILSVPGYVCPTVTDTSPFKPADSGCQPDQYRILDSKDVLRLIYYGFDHDFKGAAQRNCGNTADTLSPYLRNPGLVRAALVDNWGSLFRDPAACATGNCVRLWRAFRRNDESGTTDAFISLTNRSATCRDDVAPIAPCTAQNQVLTVAIPSINQGNRVSPFCNARQTTGVQCAIGEQGGFDNFTNPNNMPHRQGLQGINQRTGDFDVPMPPTAAGGPAGVADVNPKIGAWDFPDADFSPNFGADPYYTDFQDFDCIRRQCALPLGPTAQEQVCSARGDMGVVIPVFDPPAATATIDPFPDTQCSQGVFIAVAAPPCRDPGVGTGKPSICPNGAKPFGSNCTSPLPAAINPGTCLAPATATLDPRCRNIPTNVPTIQQRNIDGRVYNLHLHENNLTPTPDHPYVTVTRQAASATPGLIQAKLVGAFYRIHQSQALVNAAANQFVLKSSFNANYVLNAPSPSGALAAQVCNPTTLAPGAVSATRLIGCFASADRCALGYAGGEAASGTTDALRLNGIGFDPVCIQNSSYPLSRKLYLNTVRGFETVTGDELKLAKCFAVRQAGVLGAFPGIDTVATTHGFVPLDTTPANGTLCEDFNEQANCGAGSNVNACANNVAPIPQ